jgi:GTP-binding protein of the ras superfamily involved in termination of M-phase
MADYGDDSKEIAVKIGIIGETETGKTSLMIKYCENKFDEAYLQTVGVNYKEKTIPVGDRKIIVNVWDLGGDQENVHMLPLVTNDADAILFLFDLERKSTIVGIKEWYLNSRQYNAGAPVFLIGTKFDCFSTKDQEYVKSMTKTAKKFAKAMKSPLIFISSKESINISKLFKSKTFFLTDVLTTPRQSF